MKLYTDGGGYNGKVSRACVVFDNGRVLEYTTPQKKTNNEMEYIALILGLENCSQGSTIYSDSQLVVNQVKGLYAVRSQNLMGFHSKACKLVDLKRASVQWVPREQNKAGKLIEKRQKEAKKNV